MPEASKKLLFVPWMQDSDCCIQFGSDINDFNGDMMHQFNAIAQGKNAQIDLLEFLYSGKIRSRIIPSET